MTLLSKDPINLIVAGVGGQGNVLISRLIGESLIQVGYWVTIGETYGASQRGGSVASHIRISKVAQHSPITPEGQADLILGLEPAESLRILAQWGNPKTFVITNTRPVYPMSVAAGEAEYPALECIKQSISQLSKEACYVDASEIAIHLEVPLLANMVMVGALIGTNVLPLKEDVFERQLEASFKGEELSLNLQAFRIGLLEVQSKEC